MMQWWQTLPSRMDPFIIEFGALRIGWYGMMYVVGFLTVYAVCTARIRQEGFGYSSEMLQDYLVWAAFGLIIGARLGYVVFYNASYYVSHPLEVILPFEFSGGALRYTGIAGMSYHGGAIGTFIASIMFLRKHGIDKWEFADFVVPAIPLGYTFGRIGNFINGELYGRATDVPWGMYFPHDPQHALRHPSQLYEAALEGLFLFTVLWLVRKRPAFRGRLFALYIAGYGAVRFLVEFFRKPDDHLGFVLGPFSMGQLLCFAMIAIGAGMWFKTRPALSPRGRA